MEQYEFHKTRAFTNEGFWKFSEKKSDEMKEEMLISTSGFLFITLLLKAKFEDILPPSQNITIFLIVFLKHYLRIFLFETAQSHLNLKLGQFHRVFNKWMLILRLTAAARLKTEPRQELQKVSRLQVSNML